MKTLNTLIFCIVLLSVNMNIKSINLRIRYQQGFEPDININIYLNKDLGVKTNNIKRNVHIHYFAQNSTDFTTNGNNPDYQSNIISKITDNNNNNFNYNGKINYNHTYNGTKVNTNNNTYSLENDNTNNDCNFGENNNSFKNTNFGINNYTINNNSTNNGFNNNSNNNTYSKYYNYTTPFTIDILIQADTSFNNDNYTQLVNKTFYSLDTNFDAELSYCQAASAISNLSMGFEIPAHLTYDKIQHILKLVDINNSGTLDINEFTKFANEVAKDIFNKIKASTCESLLAEHKKNDSKFLKTKKSFKGQEQAIEKKSNRSTKLNKSNKSRAVTASKKSLQTPQSDLQTIQAFEHILHPTSQEAYDNNDKILLDSFKAVDSNGDNLLDLDEFSQSLQQFIFTYNLGDDPDFSSDSIQILFNKYDTDKRGLIDNNEFNDLTPKMIRKAEHYIAIRYCAVQ